MDHRQCACRLGGSQPMVDSRLMENLHVDDARRVLAWADAIAERATHRLTLRTQAHGEPSSPPGLAPLAARGPLPAKAEGERPVAAAVPPGPPRASRAFTTRLWR